MAAKPDRSSSADGLTSDKQPNPMRHFWPILLGIVVGTLLYAGYSLWTGAKEKAVAAATADPTLDKPTAQECAIAEAAARAVHASGDDRRWIASVGDEAITLDERSHVANLVNAPDVTDDEADSIRHKAAADWRWCAGMGDFVHGLGWKPMGGEEAIPELGLGRPGVDAAGDEARLYEAFIAPDPATGAPLQKGGPWLVTLNRAPAGAWQVTGRTELPGRGRH